MERMQKHQLTRWEATSLMVGAGVGAGIMAVPFLADRVGLIGLALILPVAWAASSLIHLMLAEVLFRTGRDLQIVELSGCGCSALPDSAAVICIRPAQCGISLTLQPTSWRQIVANLLASISGLSSLSTPSQPEWCSSAWLLALLNVRALALFGPGGHWHRRDPVPFRPHYPREHTSGWLYGMPCTRQDFHSVPQVAGPRPTEGAVRFIRSGLASTASLRDRILIALGRITQVTQVAIIGTSALLGYGRASSAAVHRLAFITSYWSVSLALADILRVSGRT
jgi:hypothetical protein